MGGEPGIEEERLCLSGLGHGEFDPASPESVFLAVEGNIVHEAVGKGELFLFSHPFGPVLHDGGGGALEIFIEGLVARFLADKEKVATLLPDQTTERLAGIEIVSHDGDPPPVAVAFEPVLPPSGRGLDLGVLLFLAVFPSDELRRQGDDPGLSRTNENGSDGRMGIGDLVGVLRLSLEETRRTGDRVG